MTMATAAAVPQVESQSLQPTRKPAYSPRPRRDGTRRLYAANPQALGELRAAIEAMWHEALAGMAAIGEGQEG